ncbi:MAG TPA: hypothetical protein VF299_03145 [Mycobacterium sp.]
MSRHRTAVPVAIIVATTLGLAGCSHSESVPESAELPAPPVAAPPQAGVLPPPDALTDVLYRLADPAVPGADKLNLIDGAKPTDAPTLDKFATALRDGGYSPLTLQATDIGWSERDPGDAVANVNITTPKPDTGGFSFPMEFTPYEGGWRLSHRTAELLLAFGSSRTAAPPASGPGAVPGPPAGAPPSASPGMPPDPPPGAPAG